MTKSEETRQRAEAAATKVLHDSRHSKAVKSAAGLALSQRMTPYSTMSRTEAAATSALHRPGSSKTAKRAAGCTLTQKPKR